MGQDDDASDKPVFVRRPADGLVGQTVADRYRILGRIGVGGFGKIYRAEQLPLGRQVALKVLYPRHSTRLDDPEFKRRFQLEAATCAQLAHQNIVTIFDFGSFEGPAGETYFTAMELVEGRPLSEVIREEAPLHPARAASIARKIVRALREAHRLGVVHRDLKPANVMISSAHRGEQVKVLDFGLAKVLRDDADSLTQDGIILGSPPYMAPEYIQQQELDPRADIYSLGIILYEMLCKEVPFRGEDQVQTLLAHVHTPVPPMARRGRVRVPVALEKVVMRCLRKNPEERYPSGDELLTDLKSIAPSLESGRDPVTSPSRGLPLERQDGQSTAVPATSLPPPGRRAPKRWPLIALLLLLGAAGIATAALLWLRP